MEATNFTDTLIFGIKDGVCRGVAWKQAGARGDRFNRGTVTEWMLRGWDIQTLHKDDPQAKVLHDQMWNTAKAIASTSWASTEDNHGHQDRSTAAIRRRPARAGLTRFPALP